MNNQKHLTPEQVQELIELGVEIEETTLVYIKDSLCEKPHYDVVFRSVISEEFENEYIPCPNLQEVLEILPDNIKEYKLTIWRYGNETHFTYDYGDFLSVGDILPIFSDTNPLLAATDLLKWVAKNHPDSLKEGGAK